MERALARTQAIKQGNPLDRDTMLGAQASATTSSRRSSPTSTSGPRKGAEVLTGGKRAQLGRRPCGRLLRRADDLQGHNRMRVFQEEIFGPVVSVTTFKDDAEALAIGQRHALRPRCRRVEPRCQHRLPLRAQRAGRPCLGQLLPRCIRRTPPSAATSSPASAAKTTDDAQPLPADEEHAGLLRPQPAGLLLGRRHTVHQRGKGRRSPSFPPCL